jgi:hypothetical protein
VDQFREAWFAFARLQKVQDSFGCPRCGPVPDVVIADGVTAGFSHKHVTSSLAPPTLSTSISPVHPNVRPPSKQLLVPDKTLRKNVLSILTLAENGSSGGKSIVRRNKRAEVVDTGTAKAAKKRPLDTDLHDEVIADLCAIHQSLGELFAAYAGSHRHPEALSRPYHILLRQVG